MVGPVAPPTAVRVTRAASTDQELVLMKRMLGDLDEVRLYDRALSDEDVRAIP